MRAKAPKLPLGPAAAATAAAAKQLSEVLFYCGAVLYRACRLGVCVPRTRNTGGRIYRRAVSATDLTRSLADRETVGVAIFAANRWQILAYATEGSR